MPLKQNKRIISPSRVQRAALGLIGLGTALFTYAYKVEPSWVEVVRLNVTLPRLDPAFNGYRIVQFSDLHIDNGLSHTALRRAVAMINAQRPDLIVFTGDYISQRVRGNARDYAAILRSLHAPDGKLAVMGNHDYYNHQHGAVRRMLGLSDLLELRNQVHTIQRGEAALHIAGVDSMLGRAARLDAVLSALEGTSEAAILLAHEPDFADVAAATGRFHLQLSGHTHGGQMHIPVLVKLALPIGGKRYVSGMQKVGRTPMQVYVNRGVGMTSLPLRLASRPEITVLTLQAAR